MRPSSSLACYGDVNDDELLRAVVATGVELAVPVASHVGRLESLFQAVTRLGLRVAAVPLGCVTVLPALPVDESSLMFLCNVYCDCRRRDVPEWRLHKLFADILGGGGVTVEGDGAAAERCCCGALEVLRIAEIMRRLCDLPNVEFCAAVRRIAILQLPEVVRVCERLRFQYHNDVSSPEAVVEMVEGLLQPQESDRHEVAVALGQTMDFNAAWNRRGQPSGRVLRDDAVMHRIESNDEVTMSDISSGVGQRGNAPLLVEGAVPDGDEDLSDTESTNQQHAVEYAVDSPNVLHPKAVFPMSCDYTIVTQSDIIYEDDFSCDNGLAQHNRHRGGSSGSGGNGTRKIGAVFLKSAVSETLCRSAAQVLEHAATLHNLRKKLNGGLSPPETGIVGFYDYLNNAHQRKCRETQFTRNNWPALANDVAPLLKTLDTVYREHAPLHYRLQMHAIPKAYQLFDTVFSTITVNRNFRTALHTDKSDFKGGLGLLVVIDGLFEGCDLAIPALGRAFRLRVGDVLLFDTSLLHGNTELHSDDGMWHRTSLVCYLRSPLMSSTCMQQQRQLLDSALQRTLPLLTRSGLMIDSGGDAVINVNAGDANRLPLFLPAKLYALLTRSQRAALTFANDRIGQDCGCIIAMAMGLGKTLLSLSLCYSAMRGEFAPYHSVSGGGARVPHRTSHDVLIVSPKTILPHWRQESELWAARGNLTFDKFIVADGSQLDFETALLNYNQQVSGRGVRVGHCIVVNPELLASLMKRCPALQPVLIILDEGHRVSSKQSRLKELLEHFTTRKRVVLSGTPIQNDASELYRLVEWTNPEACIALPPHVFQRHVTAIEAFVSGSSVSESPTLPSATASVAEDAVASQRFLMLWQQGYVFRFVDQELPPLEDLLVVCGSSHVQREQRVRYGLEGQSTALRASEHRTYHLSAHPICLVGFLLQLWAKHPSAATNVAADADSVAAPSSEGQPHGEVDAPAPQCNAHREDMLYCSGAVELLETSRQQDVVAAIQCQEQTRLALDELTHHSGKMTALLGIVRHVMSLNEKVVIFSQYIGVQDTVFRFLQASGLNPLAIRGRDAIDARKRIMQRFSTARADVAAVLVVSTKVGAYGVDLTAANHVVLFDSWWNPQVDAQAIARCYRRNQTRPVAVYRLATFWEDASIIRAHQRKVALFNCVVDGNMSKISEAQVFDSASPEVLTSAVASDSVGQEPTAAHAVADSMPSSVADVNQTRVLLWQRLTRERLSAATEIGRTDESGSSEACRAECAVLAVRPYADLVSCGL